MDESVVIVDDEFLIRKTLIRMIESNNTGWEVVGEASNGIEALEMIGISKPELVITDIRMPKMDGLSFVEALHARGYDTKVIILTGYKDFAYAQTALKYGVVDFWLKPCPEEAVIEGLNKIRQTIRQQKQRKQLEQKWEEEMAIRALMNRLPVSPSIIHRIVLTYQQADLCIVHVNDFFPTEKNYRKEELNLLNFAVSNIALELLDTQMESGTIIPVRFDTYVMFLGKRQEGEYADDWRERFFERLTGTIKELLGISIQARYIGAADKLQVLPDLYEAIVHDPFILKKADIGDPLSFQEHTRYSAKIDSMENEFMSYILVGNINQLEEHIRGLTRKLAAGSLQEARMEALVAAIALDRIVRQQFPASSLRLDIGKEVAALHRLQSTQEITTWIHHWSSALAAELTKWSDTINQNIIQKAVSYIEQHYAERCSLQDVAAHVFLNHKYLGHLFKRERGESFIDFVTRIRLERAAIYLSNSGLSITHIARCCGYDDPNYFSTVFRKKYQLTPNEYRKQCRATEYGQASKT